MPLRWHGGKAATGRRRMSVVNSAFALKRARPLGSCVPFKRFEATDVASYKLGVALQAALAGTESAPHHTEDREEADAHRSEFSERIMEQTFGVPVPQETKATETVCEEPAPAAARA